MTASKSKAAGCAAAVLAFTFTIGTLGAQARVYPASVEEEMLNFGIIVETVDMQNSVTFAEYTAMVMRAAGLGSMITAKEGESWYAAHMKAAKELGLYSAFENEVNAEEKIKFEYAVAMTAAILGYSAVTERTLEAWYAEGMRLGLVNGVSAQRGEVLNRADSYKLIHNALGTKICETDANGYSRISDETLEDKLMGLRGSEYLEGIVEATENASISGDCAPEGTVRINDEIFAAGDTKADEYLGSRVRFLSEESGNKFYETIIWIEPHKDNKILELDEYTEKNIRDGNLYYKNDRNTEKRIKLANAPIVVYNNRLTAKSFEEIISDDRRVKLTDNDGDGVYDIADVTAIESCVVEKAYQSQGQFVLEYATDGRKRLKTDNQDTVYEYYDADGNVIAPETIKEGDAISVIADESGECMKIYRLNSAFEGKLKTYDGQEHEVSVDSEQYKYVEGAVLPSVGVQSTFYKDLWGRIFYSKESFDSYVYIRRVYSGEDSESAYINTFEGSGGFKTYKLSGKVRIDGASAKNAAEIINMLKSGGAASIELDSSGEVKRIDTAEVYAEKGYRTYCENDFGFVDYEDKKLVPFACDKERTAVFFVPTTDNKDDYFNIFELDNDEDYVVTGFDYDERINRVRAIVIEVDPDKPLKSGFGESSRFMAVSGIRQAVSGDEVTYEVTGICGGEEITLAAAQRQSVLNVLSEVKSGDVIQLVCNWNGEIGLVRQVMDYSELNEYYYDNVDNKNTKLYASAYEVNSEVMTNAKKYLVHEIKCSVDGASVSSCLSASEEKISGTDNKGFNNYFLYNKRTKKYEQGSIDSIITTEDGANASDLFIWSQNGDAKFIVIADN